MNETVDIVEVSPAMAKEWLSKKAEVQRKLSEPAYLRHARAMAEDRFLLSNDAIVFDTSGALINGQHRLRAIIATGRAQRFIVGRGFDPKSFMIMDRQHFRRAAQFIERKYSNTVSGAAYYALSHTKGYAPKPPQHMALDPDEVMQFYWDNEEELGYAAELIHLSKAHLLGKAAYLAFLLWYYSTQEGLGAELAEEPFQLLGSGVDLSETSPLLALRNRLLVSKMKLTADEHMALQAIAVKAHFEGRSMKLLRWFKGSGFPSLKLSK